MMKTKFVWVIAYYKKAQLQIMNTAHTNVTVVTNNQQKLEHIKNLWLMEKTVIAMYDFANDKSIPP